jgi:hypothetical protein
LPPDDRRDALGIVAAASGRPVHVLEKDVWVVWTLQTLFAASFSEHLVFKGGTSLSKAYSIIRRFSEDLDITYDIRALAPDLIGNLEEALPPNRSQEKRWTKEIRIRLPQWIRDQVIPAIHEALAKDKLSAQVSTDGEKVFIEYEPATQALGYLRPIIMIEFGARSTGEPWETRPVRCDSADHLPSVLFPAANPRVMRPERTFWEKATAIHVFCAQGEFRGGDRFARHWHDITRLDNAGFADAAMADRDLRQAVARHKAIFFAEKDSAGSLIDYEAAVSGGLRLAPSDAALKTLSDDYRRMVDDGLLLDEAESFEELLAHCRAVQEKANRQD